MSPVQTYTYMAPGKQLISILCRLTTVQDGLDGLRQSCRVFRSCDSSASFDRQDKEAVHIAGICILRPLVVVSSTKTFFFFYDQSNAILY